MYEVIYAQALEAVAMGATRDETRQWLHEQYLNAAAATVDRAMADAFTDALRQGVDRDDVDPSWF